MSEPLVVVGLLSGGKDSCYNLCHCEKLGHRVAALATLAPPEGKGEQTCVRGQKRGSLLNVGAVSVLEDELDSYMYQTVGHDAIHLIAEAMELPLYRATITGRAINQSSTYGQRIASTSSHTLDAKDETEDLFTLLSMVKEAQPEINAVSVGAILSNYQRVRVEHVALRLGLQLMPLSYLWQRDQAELLDEMCQAGMDSILIKVAGAGLEEIDLKKNLAKMRTKLHKLHDFYGAHICGEGGEYETFTLDCPLFKRRIVLDKTTTVVHSDSSFASVFYLQINAAHLEDKTQDSKTLQDVTVPPLFDNLSRRTFRLCENVMQTASSQAFVEHRRFPACSATYSPSVNRIGHWCAIGNVVGRPSASITDEFRSAFDAIVGEFLHS
jgi:diphthine-ammonia ligase